MTQPTRQRHELAITAVTPVPIMPYQHVGMVLLTALVAEHTEIFAQYSMRLKINCHNVCASNFWVKPYRHGARFLQLTRQYKLTSQPHMFHASCSVEVAQADSRSFFDATNTIQAFLSMDAKS